MPICFEPLSLPNDQRTYNFYKDIREKAYSVLFTGTESIVYVNEIVYDLERKITFENQVKVKPYFDEKPLAQIWTCERNDRFRIFLECMHQREMLDVNIDIDYSNQFIVPCLVLRYMLLKNKDLTQLDIKAFLATFEFLRYYLKSKKYEEKEI